MKPNHLEEILKQEAPAPDPAARIAARRAALAEFTRVHAAAAGEPAQQPQRGFKGLLGRLRLSREPKASGSDSMNWFSNRMWIGGAASVCIAVVGSVVVWNTMRTELAPEIADYPLAPTEQVSRPAASPAPSPGAMASPEPSSKHEVARAEAQQRADLAREQFEKAQLGKAQGAEQRQPVGSRVEPKLKDDVRTRDIGAEPAPPPPPAELLQGGNYIESAPVAAPAAAPAEADKRVSQATVAGRGRLSTAAPADANRRDLVMLNESGPPIAEYEGRDRFEHFELNSIKQPAIEAERLSTFSADVDTSSYSFVRKQLDQGVLPQKDAVRIEEMVNYFDYTWPAAESRTRPFRPTVVVSDSPWGKGRKLIHIGIKGYELPARQRPDANLVMLLDVSGSMNSPDKLPLVKQSMKLLLGSLKPTDTVSIVVYAGAAGTVLPPTPVGEKHKIIDALDSLTPGGSTAGAEGIELAYQLAEKTFRKEGVNRILLCTDGDFNVGIDSTNELKGFVERKREKGVFLSVLGFGQGNYRDELAQALAQNGNGVAAYIDTLNEAQKVLVQEAGSSLFTIAKDVKFQVEFNPATVAEYRLVGYETRALKREDFNNDAVDAGDIGSGHTVTAIYEITPVGVDARWVDESHFAKQPATAARDNLNLYGFVKIRYKLPEQSKSELIEQPIAIDSGKVQETIRRDVGFSTAVAGFAQLLRGGQFTGSLSYDDVIKQALATRGEDPYGYRNEFVQLVRKAQTARGM